MGSTPVTENQVTLGHRVEMEGRGLHSGASARISIAPAGPDEGITFVRTDLPGRPAIRATVANVVRTVKCTTIGDGGGAEVQTIEHLMAAFGGLGVDNAVVEVEGPEIPVGDGSAAAFADLIGQAGVHRLEAPRSFLELARPVWVDHGDVTLVALPAAELKLSYVFTNPHPAVGTHFAEFVVEPVAFRRDIAPARTLAFMREIEALQRRGLALGGSLDMVVAIGDDGYANERRFPDEVVRHKILDLLGDISLVGPLKAHIIGVRSGHAANAALGMAILQAVAETVCG